MQLSNDDYDILARLIGMPVHSMAGRTLVATRQQPVQALAQPAALDLAGHVQALQDQGNLVMAES